MASTNKNISLCKLLNRNSKRKAQLNFYEGVFCKEKNIVYIICYAGNTTKAIDYFKLIARKKEYGSAKNKVRNYSYFIFL